MHLSHLAEQLPHPVALRRLHRRAPGQAGKAAAHQGRGVGHGAHATPLGKQFLQSLQPYSGQHRNQQPPLAACIAGNGFQLLRFDCQQHHRTGPGRFGFGAHLETTCSQPLAGCLAGDSSTNLSRPQLARFDQGCQQGLGHAAIANNTKTARRRLRIGSELSRWHPSDPRRAQGRHLELKQSRRRGCWKPPWVRRSPRCPGWKR